MSHLENREMITPSLLYSPKENGEEWIFQGQTIDVDGEGRYLTVQWFEDTAAEIDEELSEEESNKVRHHIRRDNDHFVEHDVADSAIWSLDVEKAQAVIRYCPFYIYYACQVFHRLYLQIGIYKSIIDCIICS